MSVYIKDPEQTAQGCVIWMHGLGADSSDMAGLVNQLSVTTPLRHVFIDAPRRPVTLNGGMVMPAWFDILGMELTDRIDRPGIEHSESLIRKVMAEQLHEGFEDKQLFLAGFSQGGAMALHTGLNFPGTLGGILALSAFLPVVEHFPVALAKHTPFFMASGLFDPLVLPTWTMRSKEWVLAQGYAEVTFCQYPMEHAICIEEVKDISQWLQTKSQGGEK